MSFLEIMKLAVWLLHLQLMEPAMEGSWVILADGATTSDCRSVLKMDMRAGITVKK